MSESFSEILGMAERAVAGLDAVDEDRLTQLLDSIDLRGVGQPEDRAYLGVLLDWLGLRDQAMLTLRPNDSENTQFSVGMTNLAGMLESGHGEYEQAHDLFLRALSIAPDDTPLRVKILSNLAALSLLSGEVGAASRWLARARDASELFSNPAIDVLLASTEFGIGRSRGNLATMRGSISRLNEATRARIAELDSHHPLALEAVANLSAAEFELASAEESVQGQERAIVVLEVAAHRLAADLGADHPQALACLENMCVADFRLARMTRSANRASRAASMLEAVSQRMTNILGQNHPRARDAAANAAAAKVGLQEIMSDVRLSPRILGDVRQDTAVFADSVLREPKSSQVRQQNMRGESVPSRVARATIPVLRRAAPILGILAASCVALGLVAALAVWVVDVLHGTVGHGSQSAREQVALPVIILAAVLVAVFWRVALKLTLMITIILLAFGLVSGISVLVELVFH